MLDIERVIKVVDWLIFEKIVTSRKDLALKMGYTESSMSQILNQKVPLSERDVYKRQQHYPHCLPRKQFFLRQFCTLFRTPFSFYLNIK